MLIFYLIFGLFFLRVRRTSHYKLDFDDDNLLIQQNYDFEVKTQNNLINQHNFLFPHFDHKRSSVSTVENSSLLEQTSSFSNEEINLYPNTLKKFNYEKNDALILLENEYTNKQIHMNTVNKQLMQEEKSCFSKNHQSKKKSEIDFLLEISDGLSASYGIFEDIESINKAEIKKYLAKIKENEPDNLITQEKPTSTDKEIMTNHTNFNINDIPFIEKKSKVTVLKRKYFTKIDFLYREQYLIKNTKLLNKIYFLSNKQFYLCIFSNESNHLQRNQILFDANFTIEKEIQNTIFDLIDEFKLKCHLFRSETVKKNYFFQQFCAFCIHTPQDDFHSVSEENTDFDNLNNFVHNIDMKLDFSKFFESVQKRINASNLIELICEITLLFKLEKIDFLKILKNIDKVHLGLDHLTKIKFLHHQYNNFKKKNWNLKSILLPELTSIDCMLHQIALNNIIKNNRSFLLLFFSFHWMNKFFDTIFARNDFEEFNHQVHDPSKEIILQLLAFISRLYFFEPIINFSNIRKHTQIQYSLFFMKRLQMAINSSQGKHVDPSKIDIIDQCITICLECGEFLSSQTFLHIFFEYDFDTFSTLNKKGLVEFQDYLKKQKSILSNS